ncbi:unnamed protein product [Peniophora sp. CBMAI 1063]|nr:unnamed protein product [Peniophora sp. CBMAI 1063]
MPTPSLFPTGPEPPFDQLSPEAKFNRMGSWFLGNRGENASIFQNSMASIIKNVQAGRKVIWPQDAQTVTAEMINSPEFQSSVTYLQQCLEVLAGEMSLSSVPFYSPRYAGHMSTDISLPAVLGYALAQQFNQNNVTPEASPFTSYIEYLAGQQLCHILGFKLDPKLGKPAKATSSDQNEPFGWGHITADGSIANLESIWIARNLKYYPLSLRLAMHDNPVLDFVASTFRVKLCTGSEKLFCACSPWELLNLEPSTVVEIPEQLFKRYSISSDALSNILRPFSIQTIGMDKLNAAFGITRPAQYMVSLANHYSWPKGCAITGIGSKNLIEIGVNEDIRMDIEELKKQLNTCLETQQAVFCVVAVCGTTEHGAVDPVRDLVDLRTTLAAKGMSFMIHGDAAWGGYFACKYKEPPRAGEAPRKYYAFSIGLNPWTNTQLGSLREVDTITIDPHKSGYSPYPAGALCMRDSRFRFLTTWTSAYINTTGADYNMGIYGVEGSKPGAAAVAVLLSHEIVGLENRDQGGYANLLGTAMLTGIKMYGHWVTVDLLSKRLLVTPVNRLPVERQDGGATDAQIRAQKQRILDDILRRPNEELEADDDAMRLLGELGSDTMINAFACNFRVKDDGEVNDDIDSANFLNSRLYDRLSVRRERDFVNDRPLIINRTEFKASAYGGALDAFKQRMKVKPGKEDLVALSNVSMSPFPTAGDFLIGMMEEFRVVAEQEITNCLVRIEERQSIHGFVLQGLHTDSAHLVYLPMFHIKNQQRQLILHVSMQLEDSQLEKLKSASAPTAHTSSNTLQGLMTLDDILTQGSFCADIYDGLPDTYTSNESVVSNVKFKIKAVRVNETLSRDKLSANYPKATPFYLYAGDDGVYNLDHVLTKAPNVQLSAAGIDVRLDSATPALDPSKLYKVTLDDYMEQLMQPFSDAGFFVRDQELNVTVHDDAKVVRKGTVKLSNRLSIDYGFLNQEIAADVYIVASDPASGSDPQDHADDLVTAFHNGNIEWTDNVVVAFGKYAKEIGNPLPDDVTVTLGVPESLPGDDARFAIVSRFVCKQSSDPAMRSLVWGQEWAKKFTEKTRLEYAGST